MTFLIFWGKYGKVSECFRINRVFFLSSFFYLFILLFFIFFFFFFFGNRQERIVSQHFIIIQSDQDLCPFTKLMDI